MLLEVGHQVRWAKHVIVLVHLHSSGLGPVCQKLQCCPLAAALVAMPSRDLSSLPSQHMSILLTGPMHTGTQPRAHGNPTPRPPPTRQQRRLAVSLLLLCTIARPLPCSAVWIWTKPLTEPLRICTASVQTFGARCNNGLYDEPSTAPRFGWCMDGDFCGHDVEVWQRVAERMGLVEGQDYVRICMGEYGFRPMLADLQVRASTACSASPRTCLSTHVPFAAVRCSWALS